MIHFMSVLDRIVFNLMLVLIFSAFGFNVVSFIVLSGFGVFQFFSLTYAKSDGLWRTCRKIPLVNIFLVIFTGIGIFSKVFLTAWYMVLFSGNRDISTSSDVGIANLCIILFSLLVIMCFLLHVGLVIYMFDRKEWSICIKTCCNREKRRDSVRISGNYSMDQSGQIQNANAKANSGHFDSQYHLLEAEK
jgi:hypothetical protein